MSGPDPTTAGMPGRYATALFELAEADGALDAVDADLGRFQELLDMSPDLVRLVRSPVFDADEQSRAVAAVLDKAGIGGLTRKFIGLVTANRRLFAIREMIGAFRALLAVHRGEVVAEVTSAEKLTDAQMEAVKASLAASTGREVRIDSRIDASLLGGLIVKVGSRMVDNSLRTKLQRLKLAMNEVG